MSEHLNESDIERIADALAPKLIDGVRERHHDFWIDPETHYNDHRVWRALNSDDINSLKELVRLFVVTRGLFWKAFLGFAIVGALAMSAIGLGFGKGP